MYLRRKSSLLRMVMSQPCHHIFFLNVFDIRGGKLMSIQRLDQAYLLHPQREQVTGRILIALILRGTLSMRKLLRMHLNQK